MRLTEDQAARLHALPRFFAYRDILEDVFLHDEDAFVDAWVDGSLPPSIVKACEETAAPRTLELLLLKRIVRLLGEPPESPP